MIDCTLYSGLLDGKEKNTHDAKLDCRVKRMSLANSGVAGGRNRRLDGKGSTYGIGFELRLD